MKKILLSLLAVAAVSASCQKTELGDDGSTTAPGGEGTFRLEAGIPETKTVFTPPTKVAWEDSDELAVVANSGTPVKFVKTPEGNWFESDGFTPEEGTDYTYYALYPYSASVAFADGVMSGVEIPETSQQNGPESTAHIKGALFGSAKAAGTEVPSVSMQHLTTLLKIDVTNNYGEAIALNSITVSTDDEGQQLSGTFDVDTETGALSLHPGSSSSASVVLETQNVTIEAGNSATFYIAAKEFSVPVGASLTVTVDADKGIVADVRNYDAQMDFKAGTVNSTSFEYKKNNEVTITVNEDEESFNGIAAGASIPVSGTVSAGQGGIASLTYTLISRDGAEGETADAVLAGDAFSFSVSAEETLGSIRLTATAEDGKVAETVIETHVGYKFLHLEAQASTNQNTLKSNTVFFDSSNGKIYDYETAFANQSTVDVAFAGWNSTGNSFKTIRLDRLAANALSSTNAASTEGYRPNSDWDEPLYDAPLAAWKTFDKTNDTERLAAFDEAKVSDFSGDFESIDYSTSGGKNDAKNHSAAIQTIATLYESSTETESIMVFENTAGKNVLVVFRELVASDATDRINNETVFAIEAKVEL